MQSGSSGRPQPRAPGSFSPLPSSVSSSAAAAAAAASGGRDRRPSSSSSSQQFPPSQTNARPQIRRIDTSSSDDTAAAAAAASQPYFALPRVRSPQTPVSVTSPSFPGFTAHSNGSSASLQSPQNFSRPGRPNNEASPSVRNASPLTLPPNRVPGGGHHSRKHSQSQGLFDTTLPSTSTSNLAQMAMPPPPATAGALTASQIAAQAAMQHQNQSHQQHSRHRSQTVPFPGGGEGYEPAKQRQQGSKSGGPTPNPGGPLSPPVLSLTEASVPRDGALGDQHRYHNGLLGTQAATTAANVVFPRTSPQSSPSLPADELRQSAMPLPLQMPEKPAKAEKSKVKLFSRPKKIETKGEASQKPLPSPSKIGSALASLQRGNYSTTSLAESQSMYNLNNSSSATIRASDAAAEKDGKEKEKEKEKKHHFLSRQKHKLSNKDDYHLPLSSAASNSRPVDPSAPSSLYNFNLPPSPGPNSSSFGKSVSGLDLRHGGRALREKRKEEKLGMAHENESVYTINNTTADWPGPSSLGSNLTQTQSNLSFLESIDGSKYGLNSMSLDDAWPYLKAKLLVIFEGEDLRLPIEDFNRVVNLHLQFCIQRRSSHIIIEDVRELLSTGFLSLDHTLRKTPEDRLIPALAELWIFTFTSVLPYMQAVFLPLDLEFSGNGSLLTPEQAREFWGGLVASSPAPRASESEAPPTTPASQVLDVRHLVLLSYRDTLILPRYDKLKGIFSRLSLEHLPASLASLALASPPATDPSILSTSLPREIETGFRPGTAMSLDPSVASYNSSSSTLLNEGSNPSRSRAISNVSFGSHGSEGTPGSYLRPFTPALAANGRERNGSGSGSSLRDRDQNAEFGSKQVTDMVGRMLQCMSVLASVSANSALDPASSAAGTPTGPAEDEGNKMVSELGRLLKLNWLGRGRTGRNRRGMVPGRVVRGEENRAGRSNSHTGLGIGMGQSVRDGVGAML